MRLANQKSRQPGLKLIKVNLVIMVEASPTKNPDNRD